jgi:hypothetical protein
MPGMSNKNKPSKALVTTVRYHGNFNKDGSGMSNGTVPLAPIMPSAQANVTLPGCVK